MIFLCVVNSFRSAVRLLFSPLYCSVSVSFSFSLDVAAFEGSTLLLCYIIVVFSRFSSVLLSEVSNLIMVPRVIPRRW